MKKIIFKENSRITSKLLGKEKQNSIDVSSLTNDEVKYLQSAKRVAYRFANELDEKLLNEIVCRLKETKHSNKFSTIILKFIKENSKNGRLKTRFTIDVINYLSGNLQLMTSSIFVEALLHNYFLEKMSSYNFEEVKYLEMLNIQGNSYDEIFSCLGESFEPIALENGIYDLATTTVTTAIEKTFKQKQSHLCWDCQNAWIKKCEKIADYEKKVISDYPFIIDGYQVLNNKDVEQFIVTKCKNFKKDNSKQTSALDTELEKMKEEIFGNNNGNSSFTKQKKKLYKF